MTDQITLPLSFHTGFLSDLPVLEAVRKIRDHGYEMVELNGELLPWGPAHITPDTPRAVIDKLAGMGPYSALCIHHCDFGSSRDDRRDAALAWGREMMDRAVDLGIDLVHVIPGEETGIASLHRSLAVAVEDAEQRGLTLALEAIVGRQIGTVKTALAALEAAPGLKINFDPSHYHPMGDDTTEAAKALLPHIAHVHLKDAVGGPEDFRFVPLGEGGIDLTAMLRVLLEGGYRGAVSIEHESHFFAGDARGADEVLRDCRADFDALMARAQGAPVL